MDILICRKNLMKCPTAIHSVSNISLEPSNWLYYMLNEPPICLISGFYICILFSDNIIGEQLL